MVNQEVNPAKSLHAKCLVSFQCHIGNFLRQVVWQDYRQIKDHATGIDKFIFIVVEWVIAWYADTAKLRSDWMLITKN